MAEAETIADAGGETQGDVQETQETQSTQETQETQADASGENWREAFAGGDEKRLAQLGRFTDPAKFAESYWNAQDTIRQGKHKLADVPDGSDEAALAEWRSEMGIPESPDKYELNLGDGVVVGDSDKPIVDSVIAAMHSANATPDQVNAALSAYYQTQADIPAQMQALDQEHIEEVDTALRDEWGPDFNTNRSILKNLMGRFPESVREAIAGARMDDGRGLLNSPEVVKTLVEIERMANPTASVVPNSSDPVADVTSRINEIKEIMRTDRPRYNRDSAMQAELTRLYEAESKLSGA